MKKRQLPEIRIVDGYLLRDNASRFLHELWGKDKKLADNEWMEKRVREYNKAWRPYEKKIVSGLYDTVELEFKQNTIDVYIAPWFRAFSDPMVIGVMQEPDIFVDTLTHELIHRLITDNTTVPYGTKLLPSWKKMFGDKHSIGTLIHIPVHAIHKALYLDVLGEPERLKRDIAGSKKFKAGDYIAAWDYVEKNGYKVIINELKDSYAALKAKS